MFSLITNVLFTTGFCFASVLKDVQPDREKFENNEKVDALVLVLVEKSGMPMSQAYGVTWRWFRKYGYSVCEKVFSTLPNLNKIKNKIPYITAILKTEYEIQHQNEKFQCVAKGWKR
jgi:hypothetical protein